MNGTSSHPSHLLEGWCDVHSDLVGLIIRHVCVHAFDGPYTMFNQLTFTWLLRGGLTTPAWLMARRDVQHLLASTCYLWMASYTLLWMARRDVQHLLASTCLMYSITVLDFCWTPANGWLRNPKRSISSNQDHNKSKRPQNRLDV